MVNLRKNKKAWIKILEAIFAVTIMFVIVFVFYTQTIDKPKRVERIYELEKAILEEIASNPDLRTKVLENKKEEINDFVGQRVSQIFPGFNYTIEICDPGNICVPSDYIPKQEVYTNERLISATPSIYHPKQIKIFVWIEE